MATSPSCGASGVVAVASTTARGIPSTRQIPAGSRVRIVDCWIVPNWNGHTGTVERIDSNLRPAEYLIRLDQPIPRDDGIRVMERVVCTEEYLEWGEY